MCSNNILGGIRAKNSFLALGRKIRRGGVGSATYLFKSLQDVHLTANFARACFAQSWGGIQSSPTISIARLFALIIPNPAQVYGLRKPIYIRVYTYNNSRALSSFSTSVLKRLDFEACAKKIPARWHSLLFPLLNRWIHFVRHTKFIPKPTSGCK